MAKTVASAKAAARIRFVMARHGEGNGERDDDGNVGMIDRSQWAVPRGGLFTLEPVGMNTFVDDHELR
jgi:hypothetical protein